MLVLTKHMWVSTQDIISCRSRQECWSKPDACVCVSPQDRVPSGRIKDVGPIGPMCVRLPKTAFDASRQEETWSNQDTCCRGKSYSRTRRRTFPFHCRARECSCVMSATRSVFVVKPKSAPVCAPANRSDFVAGPRSGCVHVPQDFVCIRSN